MRKEKARSLKEVAGHKEVEIHDMAALNGIPAESNALLQNCLRLIEKEEEAYQRSIQKSAGKVEEARKEKPQPENPKKVIRTVPVSMRTLTSNKTYTIRDREDVDVSENTVIKLN